MATFSIVSSGSQYSVTPTVLFSDITLGNGNILVAVVSSREPNVSHVRHNISDGRHTWTKIYGFDNELSSTTGAAHAQSVWWRSVRIGEASSLTVQSNVTVGATSYDHRLSVFQLASATTFPAGVVTSAVAGSGTSDWNNLNSGNTANANALITIDELDPVYGNIDNIPSSLDGIRFDSGLLVLCVGSASNSANAADLPTAANFDGAKDTVSRETGAADEVTTVVAFQSETEASGVKTATIDTNGANNRGVAGVVVFGNAADTGDIFTAPADVAGTGAISALITGTGDIDFGVVEVSGSGQRASVAGPLFTGNVFTLSRESTTSGITRVGDFYYVVKSDSTIPEIRQYDLDFNYTGVEIDTSAQTNGRRIEGIDTDGTRLVISVRETTSPQQDAFVYRYLTDGTYDNFGFSVQGQNPTPSGVVYRSDTDKFYTIGSGSRIVRRYSNTGQFEGSEFTAADVVPNALDLKFHNGLWFVSSNEAGTAADEIALFSPEGEHVGSFMVQHDVFVPEAIYVDDDVFLVGGRGSVANQSSVFEYVFRRPPLLTASAAVIAGTGQRDSTGTGDVGTPVTEISGAGLRETTGTGDAVTPVIDVDGVGLKESTGTGDTITPVTEASGVGQRESTGSGAFDTPITAISGSGQRESTGAGDFDTPVTEVDGLGEREKTGTGAINLGAIRINGFGEPNIGRVHRGAGKVKRQGRVTGPQQLREYSRKRKEKEAELERLRAEAMAERLRIENDAIAMLLLS